MTATGAFSSARKALAQIRKAVAVHIWIIARDNAQTGMQSLVMIDHPVENPNECRRPLTRKPLRCCSDGQEGFWGPFEPQGVRARKSLRNGESDPDRREGQVGLARGVEKGTAEIVQFVVLNDTVRITTIMMAVLA